MTPARRLRRGESRGLDRGAAAVEFALVLPLLMLLVLGCIDWGYYFFVDQLVANAAREGARGGAVSPTGTDPCTAGQAAAQNYLTLAGLSAPGVITTDCAPIVVNGRSVASVKISISYPVGSITGFLPKTGFALIPANAITVATMRTEQ